MNAAWWAAVHRGELGALGALIAQGAPVDATDRHGQTALMLAARVGQEELCRVLVNAGATLDVTAKFGLSAVMLAVVNRHVEVAQFLARSGANLALRGSGAPDFAGKTAAELALARGEAELAAELQP